MKRNSQPSATIDHYKMFKDGKHWVYAGITIAGLGSTLMLTTNALADMTTPVSATTTASAPNAPLVTNSVRLPGQLRLIRVR